MMSERVALDLEARAWAAQDAQDAADDDRTVEEFRGFTDAVLEFVARYGWTTTLHAVAEAHRTQQELEARR